MCKQTSAGRVPVDLSHETDFFLLLLQHAMESLPVCVCVDGVKSQQCTMLVGGPLLSLACLSVCLSVRRDTPKGK